MLVFYIAICAKISVIKGYGGENMNNLGVSYMKWKGGLTLNKATKQRGGIRKEILTIYALKERGMRGLVVVTIVVKLDPIWQVNLGNHIFREWFRSDC